MTEASQDRNSGNGIRVALDTYRSSTHDDDDYELRHTSHTATQSAGEIGHRRVEYKKNRRDLKTNKSNVEFTEREDTTMSIGPVAFYLKARRLEMNAIID